MAPRATATVLALSGGTTSLYLSNGGEAHETVRKANARFLRAANQLHVQLAPTRTFPLPARGRLLSARSRKTA